LRLEADGTRAAAGAEASGEKADAGLLRYKLSRRNCCWATRQWEKNYWTASYQCN